MKKYLILLLCSFHASAVYINQKGLGQVLVVPYYTVNNSLNTHVIVTNTTDQNKAIKVNFREGLNGHAVLSYNVYLDANDTWTFALAGGTSTVVDYAGQDSVLQYTLDNSCAPFLNKLGQEFLPYELVDGPADLYRAREGFIEIIEMGVLENDFAEAVDLSSAGVPADCGLLEAAWQVGGMWHVESGGNPNQELSPGTGGLMVQADIINVLEGINYSIPVTTLDGFFAEGSINHIDVGDTSFSLEKAAPNASIYANGKNYNLSFDSGQDAVSAVLMADQLIGTYGLDAAIAGKSEAVFVQPTRRFYISEQGNNNLPPYNQNSDGLLCPVSDGELSQYGGTRVNWEIYGRETQFEYSGVVADPPPPRSFAAICDSINVYQFLLPESDNFNNPAAITGSNNHQNLNSAFIYGTSISTENGFTKVNFLNTNPLVGMDVNTGEEVKLMGIPVIGITLYQFTNASAAEGLLAQYGGSHLMNSSVTVIEEE